MNMIALVEQHKGTLLSLTHFLHTHGYKVLHTQKPVAYVSMVIIEHTVHNIAYHCEQWRQFTENELLPVLTVTHTAVDNLREKALDMGADDGFLWPHNGPGMLQKIRAYIGDAGPLNEVSEASDVLMGSLIEEQLHQISLSPWPALLKKIGGRKTIAELKAPPSAVQAVAHSYTEKKALAAMDGTRTLEHIIQHTSIPSVRLYHMLGTLLHMGYANIVVHDLHGVRNHIEFDIDILLHKAHTQHYFLFLGVSPSSGVEQVFASYTRMKNHLQSLQASKTWSEEYLRAFEEMHATLEDAWYVLGNEERKESYAKHIAKSPIQECLPDDESPTGVLKHSSF